MKNNRQNGNKDEGKIQQIPNKELQSSSIQIKQGDTANCKQ